MSTTTQTAASYVRFNICACCSTPSGAKAESLKLTRKPRDLADARRMLREIPAVYPSDATGIRWGLTLSLMGATATGERIIIERRQVGSNIPYIPGR